jgi:uncharacterized protein with ATP-grasp and redox domains
LKRATELANHILTQFIDEDSDQNVNLPHEIVEKLKKDIKEKRFDLNLFTEAYRHVFNMLAVDKMIPFKESKFYSNFISLHKKDIFNHMHFKKRYSYENQQRITPKKHSPRYSQPPANEK